MNEEENSWDMVQARVAAKGRDPMGRLPGSWCDALCDVARGQVRIVDRAWQKQVRMQWRKHPSQRAVSALLTLELVQVMSTGVATLTPLGVARFDKYGTEISERARGAAYVEEQR